MAHLQLTASEMNYLFQLLKTEESRFAYAEFCDVEDLTGSPHPHVRALLSVMRKLEEHPVRQRYVTLEPTNLERT